MPGLRGERSGRDSPSNWPAWHARRHAAAVATAASLDDRIGRIEAAILECRQIVRETETDVATRLEKLENIFLLIDWHALERAIAHQLAVDVQVDSALVEQRLSQPESEASPERQSAIREVHPRQKALNAIPPLPTAEPPGLRLDNLLRQPDMLDIIDLSECDVTDAVAPTLAADAAKPPAVNQFTGSTASSPCSIASQRLGGGASFADNYNVAHPMFSDDIVQGFRSPMGKYVHQGDDELSAEIYTLQLMLSKANDEKAIQIESITEEKQRIIDELLRQVNELSKGPAADGVDELRAEIDTLQLMLSTANDEKAIQIEILTEEKQKVIDDLQRQINKKWPATDGVDELRAEIDTLTLMGTDPDSVALLERDADSLRCTTDAVLSETNDEKAILLSTANDEKAIQVETTTEQKRPTADGVNVLRAEIATLKLLLSQANDEKAVQIEFLIEEKQKIIEEDGRKIDELRKEIDMLNLMLSAAKDEKAIQVELIAEEKQTIIDELQKKVDRLCICNDLLCNEKMLTDDELQQQVDALKLSLFTDEDEETTQKDHTTEKQLFFAGPQRPAVAANGMRSVVEIVEAEAVADALEQLRDPCNADGTVWIRDYHARYSGLRMSLRQLLEKHTDKLIVHYDGHTRFHVTLVEDSHVKDTQPHKKGEMSGEYGTRAPTCFDASGYDKQVAAKRNHCQYVLLGNPGQPGHLNTGKLGIVLDDSTRGSLGQQGTTTTPVCPTSPDGTPRAPYIAFANVLSPLGTCPTVELAEGSGSASAPLPTLPPPQPKLSPSSPPATSTAPPQPALTPEIIEASKRPDPRGLKPAQPARPAHDARLTGSAGHAARRVRAPNAAALMRAVETHPALKWHASMAKMAGQEGEVRLDDPSDLTTNPVPPSK